MRANPWLLTLLLATGVAGCRGSHPVAPPVPSPRANVEAGPTPVETEARKRNVAERKAGDWIDTGAPPNRATDGRSSELLADPEGKAKDFAGAPSATVAAPAPASPAGARESLALDGRRDESRTRAGAGGGARSGNEPRAQEPALQAGEVDDNRLFEKYLTYAGKYASEGGVHRFDASERYRVRVINTAGVAVPDAAITLSATTGQQGPLYRARTAANGEALFFPAAVGVEVPATLRLQVRHGEVTASTTVERDAKGGDWTIQLTGAPDQYSGTTLDLLFLVDTTGSMSEEIHRVRDTIHSVSAQIRALPARPTLRLGMVLYRDKGDVYVTRRKPFTTDVDAFHAALREVSADGGGDEPEDLNAGLQQAIEAMDWSADQAVRMMFVIADAPPHLDYQQEYDYFLGAQRAVEKGIKVIGISTMGTNDVGEFVFRQLALLTQGRFVFVTRGGDAGLTPHHVERQDFSVQRLDDLVVRLVSEELSALGKPAAPKVAQAGKLATGQK